MSYDGFKTLCEKAGISKIGFIRHGKTSPKPEGGHDFDRLLTDEGRNQAKEAGSSFGREMKPLYHSILVSPAPRTVETAEIFLECIRNTDKTTSPCSLVPAQRLYDGTMQPEGGPLFQQLGYAPLRDYLDNPESKDRELARVLLGQYADTVIEAMSHIMESCSTKQSDPERTATDTTFWMVGHAIYLPAAALGVASILDCNPSGIETILSSNTKEAEGYLIDISSDAAEAKYLARPSNC